MEIIGEAYRELQERMEKYANDDLNVLFTGQTGSGKELFMKLYMEKSKRSGKKMTINCAAITESLLSSEVFGHEKGSFTGADTKRLGKISACNNGILALDEIGDATPQFQAAILRVCERNSYTPVGSDEEKKDFNTLIIAATNKPEKLRDDLKQRFHILPIPPLQKEDIPALAKFFMKKPLREEVLKELMSKEYPGNVRELKRECEGLKALRGDKIFSNETFTPTYYFSYDKFIREMETWRKYILPVINYYSKDYRLDRYKYKYQPSEEEPLFWIRINDVPVYKEEIFIFKKIYFLLRQIQIHMNSDDRLPAIDPGKFPFGEKALKYEKGIIKGKIEEIIKVFEEELKSVLEKQSLPLLLGYIYLKAESTNNQAYIFKVKKPVLYLSAALSLPIALAEIEFLQQYYNYNVQLYRDKNKLKEAVGLTKKSLDLKLKRSKERKIKILTGKNPQIEDM